MPLYRSLRVYTAAVAVAVPAILVLLVVPLASEAAGRRAVMSATTYEGMERAGNRWIQLDRVVLVLLLVTVLATAGCFVAWLYRARRNLEGPAGTRLRWGRGWVLFGWVIPIVNLVVPGAVVAEVTRESLAGDDATRRRMARVGWGWWICFVASLALCSPLRTLLAEGPTSREYVSVYARDTAPTPAERNAYADFLFPRDPSPFAVVAPSYAMLVAAGVLLLWLMAAITAAQRGRATAEQP